jgi:ubiquinone/menaquinone biosynthesis C-methylase UbiE
MVYLDSPKPSEQVRGQAAQQNGAEKYHGPIAEGYDAKREKDPKWICEQRIITQMLSDLPKGSTILDCPVGTGRFLDFYKTKGFQFIGADLSGDMLVQSALKLVPQPEVERWVAACNQADTIMPFRIGSNLLVNGDVRQIGLEDKSVDAAVMIRLTRWLSPADCQVAMRELQRVTRQRIVWTARVANHKHARTAELFESALSGWKITRNEAGHELDYRILEARPV